MSQIFSDVALAMQALEESLHSEDIRNLPWSSSGVSIPTPVRQVLRALEAGMNAVNRDEESVVAMLQHLRQHLEHPNASDMLLNLLSSTCPLVSDNVEEMLGAKTPLTLKRWILQALVREIDTLWANFGQLLLQRLKTFLKGFRWLDKDESGAFGQTEFVRAYMELCMQAGADAESAEGFKNAYEFQRVDAGFLFKLLAGSSEKAKDSDEVGVSLYSLVMRIVGVQEQELITLRRQVFSHYPNVEACFAAHAPKDASSTELNEEQFLQLGAWLRQYDEKFKQSLALHGFAEDEADAGKTVRVTSELERRFRRFFKGLDINCSGLLSVTEMKQALAEVAPTVPSRLVRRRVLLAYGSLHRLMNEVKRSGDDSDSEVELATGAAGRVQAEKFSELLELPTAKICNFLDEIEVKKESGGKRKVKLPKDGTDYSLEELAISVFLCKPLDKDLEELVSDVQRGDRFKALSFEDFQRFVFRKSVQDSEAPLSKDGKSASKSKPAKPAESKRASVKSFAPAKPLWSLDSGLFLAKYSSEQLRSAYNTLEQIYSNVTVNALLNSFTNISDIMAIDQKRYNGGDRVVCRVRLGSETNPLCGKNPVVAIVPSRLIWNEESGTGHWQMDGQRIKSFAQIGSLAHFLPPGSGGVRECTVWLTAPWSVTENRAFDVRVFATDSGRVPLKQVGGQVSFTVHMPSPPAPMLENFGLEPGASSCSALLHWVAPVEEKYCPPILKHILHIEPVLSPTQQVMSSGDESFKDLEVWNQHSRDIEKRKSIRVADLKRGVPYRFAVQCVHQVHSKEPQEVLGAISNFSETITMPFHPMPAQPGVPEVRAWQQTGKMEVLEILLPVEMDLVDRFCCFDIEYRSEGKSAWTRIPDSQMHMNHDPKWDDALNSYCFSCLLIGPRPVIEERDALEFRARSVNNAGPSPWSSPSESIQLGSAEDQGGVDAEQRELQLTALDVFSAASSVLSDTVAEASQSPTGKATLTRAKTQILETPKPLTQSNFSRSPRTHCRIQWLLEEGEEISYQVEVREERLPFYAAWTPLPAYYRFNKDDKVGEVLVSGLETFTHAEPLILRMLKGSGKRGVCAAVRLQGVAGPPAPPALQLARTLTAPGCELPVAELMWHEKETLKEVKPLIEARWELENSLTTEWSHLTIAQPTQMDDGEDGILNICFVQLEQPKDHAGGEGVRCSLRMRYQGPDGQKGEPSAETDAVQLVDAMQSAKAAQEFLRRSTMKKAKVPKRPQQLTIIGGGKGLWEVSWEQKGKSDKVPVYEAEVCFGTAGLEASEEDWQEVRGLYLQQMDEEGETGALRLVTAAIALPHDAPNDKAWRLRVHIEGGDWSTPTAWQEPGVVDFELPLPGQPTVRSNAFTFALQWEVSGHWTLIQHLQYEVQVQARKRRSSKFSDWIALTTYYTISDQVSDNVTIVKALVERAAASDAIKASFGYEELRFRVRAMSASGVSAPSEPSETEMLVITRPAAEQPPPAPDLLGKGSVLWEDEKSNSLFHSALMHVTFPKPQIDMNELNEGLPPLEYKLEAQFDSQKDESDWRQVDRTLIFCDESTDMITALVPTLDEDAEEAEEFDFEFAKNDSRVSFARRLRPTEMRFRLSAERVGCDILKFDPVHSKPSSTFSQDLPGMPWNLNVFGVSGDMLCVNFQWSVLARSCQGLLWACLDVKHKQPPNPEEEVPEAGETSEDIDVGIIGGIPVFWVPASDLRTLYGHYSSHASSDASDIVPSELVSKACAKTNEASCVGMIPLPKSCRDMTAVRVRLQMSTRNAFGQTTWSQPFVKQIKADAEEEQIAEAPAAVCSLHLKYPEWTCILPGDDEMLQNFSPRVVLLETSPTGAREVVLLDKAVAPKTDARFVFTVKGVLPKCLHVDSSTGIITWSILAGNEPDDDPMMGIMDTFVIQVTLVESWYDEQQGFHAAASLCASVPLHLAAAPSAFGADEAAWDFIRGILRGLVMEVLQGRGSETMQAACELLQDEELVEGFADICETLASDVGLAAYEVLMRVLELPGNYIELAAELDPDDFLDLICLALDTADDEPNSQGQRSESDEDLHFGGIEGSDEGNQSPENDGLGTSSSDEDEQEDFQMPLALDGEVRIEVNPDVSDTKINVQHVNSGRAAPQVSPASSPPPGGGSAAMLVGLTKAIAVLGRKDKDKDNKDQTQGRRSSVNRGGGTITARRASRAELQQLRRASHLKLDGSTDNLEGLGVSSSKLRSFRRMSSHLGNGTQNQQADEVAATRSLRPEKKETPEVEISYPDMVPMWPAFEECEFTPCINIHKAKASTRRRSIMHSATHAGLSPPDDSSRLRDSLQFSISPGLPSQISMDETTGIIKGCPFLERVAGCRYTISASDRSSGEVVGKCTILFAVAPAEVAQLCNVAFRGQDVSKPSGVPFQAKAPAKGYPGEQKDAASGGEPWVSNVTPRLGQPWSRVPPPLHSATTGPSPVRSWMTVQQALNASLTKHSSRQSVIQLGPPLKDRQRNRKEAQSSTPRGAQQLPPVNISRPRN